MEVWVMHVKKLEHYILSNGMEIPCIGYGTFPYKCELLKAIPYAIKHGHSLIDTSDDYHNYVCVGEAVRKYKEIENIVEVIIEMKISWPFSPKYLRNQVLEGKKQLKIPQDKPIDILLIHFPYPYIYVDAWKEMEKLYKEGKCRAIGVCNFEAKHLEQLKKHCEIMPMINQFELHPLFRQQEICSYCEDNGIQIMAYSPVCRMNPKLIKNEKLVGIAKKHNKSVIQVIMRWNYQHKYIPISASSKCEHIVSNIDIFDFKLSDADMDTIDKLDCGFRIRYNPNTMYRKRQRIKCLLYHWQYLVEKNRTIFLGGI